MPCVPLCAYRAAISVAWGGKRCNLDRAIGNFISHTTGGLLEFARG